MRVSSCHRSFGSITGLHMELRPPTYQTAQCCAREPQAYASKSGAWNRINTFCLWADFPRRRKSAHKQNVFIRVQDRKSTRLNSSHTVSAYAVCCLKKKQSVKRLD